ncbi:MAG: glycosyltransferase family 4 protein [Caldilineaceae bacterium]|nr:glycosyltransferase family 4 protein [Caldilineaceae bacterium]
MSDDPQLRVLHLVHQYPPDYLGGTELYTQTVAKALSARDYPVAVFTRRNADGVGSEDRLEADVAVHMAWNGSLTPTQRFLSTFGNADLEQAFGGILERFQPELIHIQHLMGLPITLLKQIRRRRIPFVVTLHDFWWVCANAQLITNYSGEICDGPNLWINCARCALARSGRSALWPAIPLLAGMLARRDTVLGAILREAAQLIAPSHFVKDWYTNHGIPGDRIQVLPHGIDLPALPSLRASHARPRLLYAGGLAWQKGVHVLMEALAGMNGSCELWIAGDEAFDPEYSRRLRAIAHGYPDSQISFLGKLSRQDLWQTLTRVDAVVVPALWYETFSLIIHEAFAAGVPVIASNLGALAEAVHHEVDGLLVEAGSTRAWRQTLQRLIDDPTLLGKLRQQVRPPLGVDEHIARLQRIYTEVIRSHGQ